MKKFGFLGAGNMAFAMAGAVIKKGGAEVSIFDISQDRMALFQESFSQVNCLSSEVELVELCDVIVLAVKPQVMPLVLKTLSSVLTEGKSPLFISIAAGLPLSFYNSYLPGARIVRVMPNTPALVGEAASGYTLGSGVTERDKALVDYFLSASGQAEEVSEVLMDAVTAVSGSGPAFFARIAEAFMAAGEAQGLSPQVARTLTLQTMKGTASLMEDKDLSPEELVKMVSSPGGTTVAGREVLEASALHQIITSTVARTAQRSKELGK